MSWEILEDQVIDNSKRFTSFSWLLNKPVNTCTAPSTIYDGEVFWSSDSTIVYDIEGDGKGPVTQELLGSPLVHG
ncbi:hypothetical protein [Streptomyces hokutonensis]|uniref:hypothetical protein n=1 Tax=Streptomyces hokutonensis TaxID=1306990 RepID=UPI0036D1CF6B